MVPNYRGPLPNVHDGTRNELCYSKIVLCKNVLDYTVPRHKFLGKMDWSEDYICVMRIFLSLNQNRAGVKYMLGEKMLGEEPQ